MTEADEEAACDSPWPSCYAVVTATVIVSAATLLILEIVVGNLLVTIVFLNERKLRNQRQHWLIVSLAAADFLVGLLVMPVSLLFEIVGEWTLGLVICELWLALDVLFVTASILNLCAISLDRYWSVSQPTTYFRQRTPRRMATTIGVTWLCSFCICVPPLAGFRPERRPGRCELSTNVLYVLYSALGSFWLPVLILAVVYARIHAISRRFAKRRRGREKTSLLGTRNQGDTGLVTAALALSSATLAATDTDTDSTCMSLLKEPLIKKKSSSLVLETIQRKVSHLHKSEESLVTRVRTSAETVEASFSSPSVARRVMTLVQKRERKRVMATARDRLLKLRERRATFVLGIILSAFTACWTPFFTVYVLAAFGVATHEIYFKVFFWMGYCNSALNPIIYTVFNPDFRKALKKYIPWMYNSDYSTATALTRMNVPSVPAPSLYLDAENIILTQ